MKSEKELLQKIIANSTTNISTCYKMVLNAIAIVRDTYIENNDEVDIGFLVELKDLEDTIKSK
jgi:hypothetical protein